MLGQGGGGMWRWFADAQQRYDDVISNFPHLTSMPALSHRRYK
jgi:hypothetical protein